MNTEKKVTIIIPCYNEYLRLKIDDFQSFSLAYPDIYFLFVDDGSTDDTPALLSKLQKTLKDKARVITLRKNTGKAEATRRGILSAIDQGCDYTGYWDADLSTPLTEIPGLVHAIENKDLDIAIGSRVKLLGYHIERKLIRHIAGRIFATIASNTLGLPVYDTQCGAKVFKNNGKLKIAFSEPFICGWSFDVEVLRRYLLVDSITSTATSFEEVPLREWRNTEGSKVKSHDFFIALYELLHMHIFYKRASTKKVYADLIYTNQHDIVNPS